MRGERRTHRSPRHFGVKSNATSNRLYLLQALPLRPGETVAGSRTSVHFCTNHVYTPQSPGLIVHSALYFVSMRTMPEVIQKIFITPETTNPATLPGSRKWSGVLFRDIFNTHYATADEWIESDTSTATDAALPPLIHTMDVVNDDEQELTYEEFIFQQTGFHLPIEGCQRVSSRTNLIRASGVMPVHGPASGQIISVGNIRGSHKHSVTKNLLAREYGFLALVDRDWETR